MKQYELVVILHPDLEIDVDTPIAKVEKLIKAVDGVIAKRDNWGKKRLAYTVKKQQFGIYVLFELDLDPQKVRQLESTLLITEEVLRFLIVNRIATPPKVVARTGAGKDDAGDKVDKDSSDDKAADEATKEDK